MQKKIKKNVDIAVLEDVLTSNVFGFMCMIDHILLRVLETAKSISNHNSTLKDVIGNASLYYKSFELWRTFDNQNEATDKVRDEPDVYFELDNGKKIIVEVKFWSDESGKNQLADYALLCDHLIYLTQTFQQKKVTKEHADISNLYLLDWKEFEKKLADLEKEVDGIEHKIIQKVRKYLRHKIGSYWDGWTKDFSSEEYINSNFYNGEKNER